MLQLSDVTLSALIKVNSCILIKQSRTDTPGEDTDLKKHEDIEKMILLINANSTNMNEDRAKILKLPIYIKYMAYF